MEDSLSNSFYYFFSATPQVLGGILALFGVFVIFKIQALTVELVDKADSVYKIATFYRNKDETKEELKLREEMLIELLHEIRIKNVKTIDATIEKYVDVIIPNEKKFLEAKEEYRQISRSYHSLINDTIKSSVITAITIVLCLAIIPFGKSIICHSVFLKIAFVVILISVTYIFYNLYRILKKALN